MENKIYTITKSHDTIASAIYTSAGISLPEEFQEENFPVRWVKALWDTGATHTAVSDRLANELNLPFEDFVDVSTATGIMRVPVYPVRISLPNNLIFEEIEAVQFSYTDEDDCDLILGMDIMTQGDVALTNSEGRTVFSFRVPSLHCVDFEVEHAQ